MSNQLATKGEDRLTSLIKTDGVKKRFEEMLGKKSASFLSSIISAVNSNPMLKDCEPMSIISAASVAASMDLPINPSLGFAHIVGYRQKDGPSKAQFQLGWKGYIQLAMRTGQYKTINTTPVLEGQIKKHNSFTGEMEFQQEATSNKHAGYLLYFKLINGYEKYFYMTTEQCEIHGKKYSKTYAKGFGRWAEDFEAMALKTVVKMGLSKYGILSTEMQRAFETDQAAIREDGTPEYIDGTTDDKARDVTDEKPKSKTKPSKLAQAIKSKVEAMPEVKNYAPGMESGNQDELDAALGEATL